MTHVISKVALYQSELNCDSNILIYALIITLVIITRSSAVAVIADRTAAVRSAETTILCDFYFNAIHCDRSVSTCE